ncbi:MAG: VTT domain-containing protein [Rhodospirillales bacterium]
MTKAVMGPKVLIRGLVFIATLAILGYVLKFSGLDILLDKAWIDAEVRGRGLGGIALFVGVAGLATAIGLPRQIVSFLGGYAFGFALGTLLALAGTVAGCICSFFYSRMLGRELVASRFPGRVRRIDGFLSENPFSMTLLIRLLPLGSNLVTCLAAGVSRVGAAPFVAGSAIGYIPQTMVFALVGSGIHLDPALRIGISVVLFVVSGILGVYLYRRHRHGKTFDTRIEEALGGDEGNGGGETPEN